MRNDWICYLYTLFYTDIVGLYEKFYKYYILE